MLSCQCLAFSNRRTETFRKNYQTLYQTTSTSLGMSRRKETPDSSDPRSVVVSNDMQNINVDEVSEAEALLACRAYLQRRQRLGQWRAWEERKRRYKQAFSSFETSDDDEDDEFGDQGTLVEGDSQQENKGNDVTKISSSIPFAASTRGGFFWEDPSQLKYYRPNSFLITNNSSVSNVSKALDETGSDEVDSDLEEEEEPVDAFATVIDRVNPRDNMFSRLNVVSIVEELEDDDTIEQQQESVYAFFDEPSESRIKRSQGAKRKWSDPEWKSFWYQKRWGNKVQNADDTKYKSTLEERLRRLQPETFLANEAVAAMTHEEIAEAIRSYVSAREKRSVAKKKSLKEQKELVQSSGMKTMVEDIKMKKASVDSILKQDAESLAEARRKRAERAQKAYQKRLENQKKNGKSSPRTRTTRRNKMDLLTPANTPKAALERVEFFLDQNLVPEEKDVVLLLEPQKLARRRDVLRRILEECFQLRGKCVPVDLAEPDADSKLFVTQAPIHHLGEFCLTKIRESLAPNNV